jgi:hypothetical protein
LSIVLITPPAIAEETLGGFGGATRKQAVVRQYADVVLGLAQKWGKKGREEQGKWRVEAVDMHAGVLAAAKADGDLASFFT